ncbi:MAG: hypothetical protein WC551_11285 [Patescibacteria group bacterium]
MSGHTPGPWRRIQNHILSIDANVAMTLSEGMSASKVEHRISKEEAEANAHLIAAAPDMLEALLDLLQRHCNLCVAYHGENLESCRACPSVNLARAVIAKAKGGKS